MATLQSNFFKATTFQRLHRHLSFTTRVASSLTNLLACIRPHTTPLFQHTTTATSLHVLSSCRNSLAVHASAQSFQPCQSKFSQAIKHTDLYRS